MERTMSVEEKIRKAEQIYERRHGNQRSVATVKKHNKKDIKLFKKMVVQMIICMSIYLSIYVIENNEFPFSKDFIDKTNEVLSYDTNFIELYENIKNYILGFINSGQENNSQEDSIGGAQENDAEQEKAMQEGEENKDESSVENQNTQNLSEEESRILAIKNTTTFIKPVEGVISSKYGYREQATGTVPKNHTGTDIAASLGTKIVSATDGEVVLASEEGDYGKHLKIQIGEVSIIYAHCNQLYVKQSDKVTQGQEIAEVGTTGNSTRTTFAL